jgi:putative oxidoreductase
VTQRSSEPSALSTPLTTWALFLLRVVAGLMLFQAGAMKLLGWYGGMPGGGTVPIASQLGVGAIFEIVGGILLMLGLFTRPAAFLLSGQMAVAYWQFHFPSGRWPLQNQGQPAVLLCFICLYLAAVGGGDISLDAVLKKRRSATT